MTCTALTQTPTHWKLSTNMTQEEKMARLTPSHDHFEQLPDPWHVNALAGTPAESYGTRGVQRKVWYSFDWCGNPIQEWGEDTPPGLMPTR